MDHKQYTTREVHQITTPIALGDQIMHQDFKDQNSTSLEMLAGNRQQKLDFVVITIVIRA
jgi:hypothetical protein